MMTNKFFPEIHGNFGFGMMRLPMQDKEIDIEQVKAMVDAFLEAGFNYFDTAHGYHSGKSETTIREALTSRYPRDKYLLTDKLTAPYFEKQEDIEPFFRSQLSACGVDYFDFYLMHAQGSGNFPKFKSCRAYETAFALKEQGLIRHVGISFHDSPEVLDEILNTYPQIEMVQLQLNYLDWNNPGVQSGRCYEVCVKHGKPVSVMEPVKGGSLVNLPEEADRIFRELGGGSNASYAVRFAASHENVRVVLSGMSTFEQMEDNVKTMKDFVPLNDAENEAIAKVVDIIVSKDLIPCTACHYCTEGCPMQIRIPEIFECLNRYNAYGGWNYKSHYNRELTGDGHGKASECLQCGQCEGICPQGLPIISLLQKAAETLEK